MLRLSLQVTQCRQRWIPGAHSTPVSINFCLLFSMLYFSFCVLYVFSDGSIIPSPRRDRSVCLVIENFSIYVSYFLYFFGYLLHSVVYNIVVCINTIIYFSIKMIPRQIIASLEAETPAYWSMFFSFPKTKVAPCKPEYRNLWPVHHSCLFPFLCPRIWSYWTLE